MSDVHWMHPWVCVPIKENTTNASLHATTKRFACHSGGCAQEGPFKHSMLDKFFSGATIKRVCPPITWDAHQMQCLGAQPCTVLTPWDVMDLKSPQQAEHWKELMCVTREKMQEKEAGKEAPASDPTFAAVQDHWMKANSGTQLTFKANWKWFANPTASETFNRHSQSKQALAKEWVCPRKECTQKVICIKCICCCFTGVVSILAAFTGLKAESWNINCGEAFHHRSMVLNRVWLVNRVSPGL